MQVSTNGSVWPHTGLAGARLSSFLHPSKFSPYTDRGGVALSARRACSHLACPTLPDQSHEQTSEAAQAEHQINRIVVAGTSRLIKAAELGGGTLRRYSRPSFPCDTADTTSASAYGRRRTKPAETHFSTLSKMRSEQGLADHPECLLGGLADSTVEFVPDVVWQTPGGKASSAL
jgi:hypothetical protein